MQKKRQPKPKPVPTVQEFIQKWEDDVHNQLTACKNLLFDCSPADKAFYRAKVNTLNDVLSHLQRRAVVRMRDRALRDQVTHLEMALQTTTRSHSEMAANYKVQRRINRDLNIQLNKQLQSMVKAEKEKDMLLHHMVTMEISCSCSEDRCLSDSVLEEQWTRVPSLRKPSFEVLKNKLIDQTETIARLSAKLLEAEKKLDTQRQKAKDELLAREKEWATRVEMLERHPRRLESSAGKGPKPQKQYFGQSHGRICASQRNETHDTRTRFCSKTRGWRGWSGSFLLLAATTKHKLTSVITVKSFDLC